jgi:WD40 repeat protein
MNVEQIDLVGRQIHFEAPQHVREAVASLGRTEDVRFSPSNRRLAIADHFGDKIVVFEVSIEPSRIAVTSVVRISSAHLKHPHGLDFIDDERIVVANRDGQVCIFELPSGAMGDCELEPSAVFDSPEISSPGSVAVSKNERGLYEALICNNYTNKITRHLFDFGKGGSFKKNTVLLKKWIRHPDGICVSKHRQWIAVSNHPTHAIYLYKNDPSLNASSAPIGILRHYYPHGLRFASADRLLISSSAGSPYVHIYQASDSDWRGVRSPALSIKVISDEDYLRLRDSRTEGGPKGIDINNALGVLVMTCQQHPLAFFDLDSILKNERLRISLKPEKGISFLPENLLRGRKALQVQHQLYLGQIRAAFTSIIRWVLTKIPTLSWILNKGRKLWNPQFLTRPF